MIHGETLSIFLLIVYPTPSEESSLRIIHTRFSFTSFSNLCFSTSRDVRLLYSTRSSSLDFSTESVLNNKRYYLRYDNTLLTFLSTLYVYLSV